EDQESLDCCIHSCCYTYILDQINRIIFLPPGIFRRPFIGDFLDGYNTMEHANKGCTGGNIKWQV
ncbi:MAG TPA: hypothetical protein PK733_19645, partial [Clostridiales bacterium]|nr:hypothetical protein [Clostridiales bacterium]